MNSIHMHGFALLSIVDLEIGSDLGSPLKSPGILGLASDRRSLNYRGLSELSKGC